MIGAPNRAYDMKPQTRRDDSQGRFYGQFRVCLIRELSSHIPPRRSYPGESSPPPNAGATALNGNLQEALNPTGGGRHEIRTDISAGGPGAPDGERLRQECIQRRPGARDWPISERGDPYRIVAYDREDVSYDFSERDELLPAYATSVHGSQGSEYPAVIVPVSTQHYPMLQRSLIYTAVTRARKLAADVFAGAMARAAR